MARSLARCCRSFGVLVLAGLGLSTSHLPVLADDKGSDIFAAARAAVAAGRIAKTDALGFTLEKKAFSETLSEGGVLVGFHEKKSSFVADMTTCPVLPPRISARPASSSERFWRSTQLSDTYSSCRNAPVRANRTPSFQPTPARNGSIVRVLLNQ